MDYVIKIGKDYIGFDCYRQYVKVSDINKAIRGELHKLTNIVGNCISPSIRKDCKVVAFKTANSEANVKKYAVEAPKHVEEVHVSSMFDTVLEQIKKIDLVSFHKEHSELSKKMSRIDQEIVDIQHYIEFNRMNAAEGYKAFKLLQDKLLERRVIKDDLFKFQMLASAKVSDIYDGTLDDKIDEFYNRDYAPRVLKELFTD